MRGVVIHGVLLLAALIFGYQTWTRDKTVAAKTTVGEVGVFSKPFASLKSVSWETPKRTTKIERRGEGANAYFWAVETKTTEKPVKKPKPDPDAGAAAVPDPPPEIVTTTREFPISVEMEKTLKELVNMHALRGLGKLEAGQLAEYELEGSTTQLNLVFDDGARSFVVGGETVTTKDRFVMDTETSKAYVLAKSMVEALAAGEAKVKLKDVHAFKDEELTAVTVAGNGKTLALVRTTVTENEKQTMTWARAETPTVPDQTLANVVKRIGNLRATKYDPEVDVSTLTEMVTLTYSTAAGKAVGHTTIYKREKEVEVTPPTPPPAVDGGVSEPPPPPEKKIETEYFLATERTRVPGSVIKSAVERIEQDLAEMLK